MHGGDIYSFKRETGKTPLDFSENTNPYGLPKGVQDKIIESVALCNVYPDPQCRELTEAVATYYGIAKEQVLFGNGAADIIFKIAYALRPKKALILAPTFAEYELSLQNVGTEIQYFNLEEMQEFSLTEAILTAIPGNNMVYICNPNNPTGKVCSRELMVKIAETCKKHGAYLVVDECFLEFVSAPSACSLMGEIEAFDQLIILKAFTKLFAMAGLRLGFCISSNPELLGSVQQAGQPWSVSTVAQVAGIACCQEHTYVEESLADIQIERAYLMGAMQELGIKTYESDANYILFRGPEDLAEHLRMQGIMIRSCGNYVNLDDTYYRIGVKRHLDNEKLVKALIGIMKD